MPIVKQIKLRVHPYAKFRFSSVHRLLPNQRV